jgi:phosphate acetyltransferase
VLRRPSFCFWDCAINPNPTAEQLAEIAISSADSSLAFGIEPKIAMLSYSSGASGKGDEVDKVRAATEIVRKKRPDLKIEGPTIRCRSRYGSRTK